MEDMRYRIGLYLLGVATLMIAARFVMPTFIGQPDNVLWEWLIILGMVVYLISAVFLFLGRKKK